MIKTSKCVGSGQLERILAISLHASFKNSACKKD